MLSRDQRRPAWCTGLQIGHLYQKLGDSDELWSCLDGIFACVIVDARTGAITAARDPMGICPLYWGRSRSGAMWFASEMKAIQHQCDDWLTFFPPVSAWAKSLFLTKI